MVGDPWPSEEEVDKFSQLYHVKRGYFVFPDGKKIAFDGSFNETDSGHKHNTETANVYKDWLGRDQFRAENIIKNVDRDWNEENKNLHIRPLSKELIELIKESAPSKRPKLTHTSTPDSQIEELISPESSVIQKSLSSVELRKYQQTAIEKWEANSFQGILAMATGSGKTITAIEAISRFRRNNKGAFVIIVVPKINLATQWVSELKNFELASMAHLQAKSGLLV